ncbi:unnamed protein product [Rotaria socialis]|uniref:Uncharacterized protein n=1 Tax=Rotaria socialis TaxID=392032 RepID=A0A817YR81_9BILA|nr:unnamed protein product [Rotaria socialis]CAF4603142.1 unnamed protein product [Rotaria socialis]
MQRTLLFKFILALIILISSSYCEAFECNITSNILQCSITNTAGILDTLPYNLTACNSISIIYSGQTTLRIISASTKPIFIQPVDTTNGHTVQILSIDTNASRIEIKIILLFNTTTPPLFTTNSRITALNSNISVNVAENYNDASAFQIFTSSNSSMFNFANYEIIFDQIGTKSSNLYLPNLIGRITNVKSIMISGNNHYLIVDGTPMVQFDKVTQLSLKYLRLYDQILDYFPSLQVYSIAECQYNRTAQFLISSRTFDLSLKMQNNIPIDSTLPNNAAAFQNLAQLTSLALIEPKLNSSCLQAIQTKNELNNLLLNLGSYAKSDFNSWITYKPLVQTLTINNISTLDIFASKFFNKFHRISQVKLKGGFTLEKKHICIFYRMNIQVPTVLPIVDLNNGQLAVGNDPCADIYITAINQRTTNNVQCSPSNTCDDCKQWAKQAALCGLISYENNCAGDTSVVGNGNPFTYNGSYLYYFFQNISCATSPTVTGTSDSVNIGAIVGAVCGLLIALMILAITVFCIYRSRQRDSAKNLSSLQEKKYKLSSSDSTHVSIATSKSSKSSRYVLEKSFFPPIQSNDEIAPPLYTTPSESVGYLSNYQMPPVPSAPRASVSTHTTHLYETLDT